MSEELRADGIAVNAVWPKTGLSFSTVLILIKQTGLQLEIIITLSCLSCCQHVIAIARVYSVHAMNANCLLSGP